MPIEPEIHTHFYRLAMEYYISARAANQCGVISVTGNLLHHAVEMLLKGQLSKTVALEELKSGKKYAHKLPSIWTEFKALFPTEDLTEFDNAVSDLDRFDLIRYPDRLKLGAMIGIGMGRGRPEKGLDPQSQTIPQYQVGIGDIDALFDRIFPLCRMNPKAYMFVTDRGADALDEHNHFSSKWR